MSRNRSAIITFIMSVRKTLVNSGFSTVLVLLLVIAITLASSIFLYVRKSNQKQIISSNNLSNTQKEEQWAEYKNSDAKLKFSYPKSWVHTENANEYFEDPRELGRASGKLVSPSGKLFEWEFTIWGGGGGDCEPEAKDVPFAEGNVCPSKQIYSVEKLAIPTGPENELFKKVKELVITKTKHRSSLAYSPITYQICLDDRWKSNPELKPTTTMGLLFPCEFWKTGFNARFEVENEAEFDSGEAKTAQEIMRTFDSY